MLRLLLLLLQICADVGTAVSLLLPAAAARCGRCCCCVS
jgi:hypothetical protein